MLTFTLVDPLIMPQLAERLTKEHAQMLAEHLPI